MIDFDRLISYAQSGKKLFFGSKQTVAAAKSGRAAVLIVASNCPVKILHVIQHHSRLSNIPVYTYPFTSLELGAACGKPFAVSSLVVREIKDPDVLRMIQRSKMNSTDVDK